MEAVPVLATTALLAIAALVYSVVVSRKDIEELMGRVALLEQPRKYRRREGLDYLAPTEVYSQPVEPTQPAEFVEPTPPQQSLAGLGERKRPREETYQEPTAPPNLEQHEKVSQILSRSRKDSKDKFMSLMQDLGKKPVPQVSIPVPDIETPVPESHQLPRALRKAQISKPGRTSAFSPATGLSLTSRNAQFQLGRSTSDASSPLTAQSPTSTSGSRNATVVLGPGPTPYLFGREDSPEPREEFLMDRLPYKSRDYST